MEMVVLAKDGIEVSTRLCAKPAIKEPTESIYELEITGKIEAGKRKRDTRNQKKVNCENQTRNSSRMRTILQQFPMGRSRSKCEKLYLLVFRGGMPNAASTKTPRT